MKNKLVSLVSFLAASQLLAATTPAATVTTFTATPDHGSVEFLAVGKPAMLKIAGKGEGPQGALTLKDGKYSGELKFKLETLNTGINLRDTHMKEKYLKVAQNPTATLKINTVATTYPITAEQKEVPFTGTLELNGKTQEVAGKATLTPKANGLGVDSAFEIKLTDYGIEIPSYMGITVAEKVNVQVKIDQLLAKKTETPVTGTKPASTSKP